MAKDANGAYRALWAWLFVILATAAMAANQPPFPGIGGPPYDTVFGVGDNIEFRAYGNDPEGGLTKIEFYVDGSFIGEDFVPPYRLWWSTQTPGTNYFHVVAVDDAFARGTSFVSRIVVAELPPRRLDWAPTTYIYDSMEWNGTSVNWRSGGPSQTVFHPGDTVAIFMSPTIFIGTDGVPMPVSPAGTTIRGSGGMYGGDILTGGVTLDSGSRVAFSNYTSSLSFPGGTLILPSPGILFDVSGARPGASLHFGTGPITNDSTTFMLQTGDAGITFENDFVIRGGGQSTLAINPTIRANASVRFSGALYLGSDFRVQIYSDTAGAPRPPHEWAGPVVLRQDVPRSLRLGTSGGGSLKGLVISGNISDGPGNFTNGLVFAPSSAPIRLTGANTYTHGTRFEPPNILGIEVAPESSLGTGDVEAFGYLTLLGSRNIGSNANVSILSGRTYLGRGVKIRVNSLKLGNTVYTNGIFAGTNIIYGNYLASNGAFRLPSVNLNPSISITNPLSGASFPVGETIPVRASVSDVDSYITQVEFRINGAPFAVSTNAPFRTTLREAPAGIYHVQAVAYDDDGGVGASSIHTFSVQPRIDHIETRPTNLAVLEFDAPLLTPFALEAAETLPSAWTNIASFPTETIRRRIRFTNALPDNVRTRFYRIALP